MREQSDGTLEEHTALDVLKEEILAKKVVHWIAKLQTDQGLSVEDWQALHAFVSLMCNKDPAAREWLTILTSQLDTIMTQLAARADVH